MAGNAVRVHQDYPPAGWYWARAFGQKMPVPALFITHHGRVLCQEFGSSHTFDWTHERECLPPDERNDQFAVLEPIPALAGLPRSCKDARRQKCEACARNFGYCGYERGAPVAGLSRTEGEPTPPRGNDGGEHAD